MTIMRGFLGRFEPVDHERKPDSSFDVVIDLNVEADSRTNLETVLLRLKHEFPGIVKKMPTSEEMDKAIEFALNEYQISRSEVVSTTPVEYYALKLPYDAIINTLESNFQNAPQEQRSFFEHLKVKDRAQKAFHITLAHCASLKSPDNQQIPEVQSVFDSYAHLTQPEKVVKAKVQLDKVVWDGRVMAISVKLTPPDGVSLPCLNNVPHVTIGTKTPDIKPKESINMLKGWMNGKVNSGIYELDLGGFETTGELHAQICHPGGRR